MHALFCALVIAVQPQVSHGQATAPTVHPNGLQRPASVYRHASTAQEGILRGRADLTAAEGEARANHAYAAYVTELAREREIANRTSQVEAWWNLRKLYRERRYGNRPSQSATVQQKTAPSVESAPQRLAPNQFDAEHLVVYWPSALRDDSFADERSEFLRILTARNHYNYGPGSQAHVQANQTRDRMLEKLRGQIRDLSPRDYLATKRFIEILALEANFPG